MIFWSKNRNNLLTLLIFFNLQSTKSPDFPLRGKFGKLWKKKILLCWSIYIIGLCLKLSPLLLQALNYMQQDLAVAKKLGDIAGECRAHGNLGSAYFSKGNYKVWQHGNFRSQIFFRLENSWQLFTCFVLWTVSGFPFVLFYEQPAVFVLSCLWQQAAFLLSCLEPASSFLVLSCNSYSSTAFLLPCEQLAAFLLSLVTASTAFLLSLVTASSFSSDFWTVSSFTLVLFF